MGEIISSVIVSAAMLAIVGFSMAAVSSNSMVEALGILIGRGALIPLVVVNLCLPALLTLVDKLLPYTTWKANFYKETASEKEVKPDTDPSAPAATLSDWIASGDALIAKSDEAYDNEDSTRN